MLYEKISPVSNRYSMTMIPTMYTIPYQSEPKEALTMNPWKEGGAWPLTPPVLHRAAVDAPVAAAAPGIQQSVRHGPGGWWMFLCEPRSKPWNAIPLY